jgi:cytoskeletal protein RodZ
METLGTYLKRERELRNISLKEVSKATKIRENLLRSIEEDRHDLLPTPVFVKGFLIAYGRHIGLDPSDVVLRYESDLKEIQGYEEKKPTEQQKRRWNRGFLLGIIVFLVGIGMIFFNLWREPAERGENIPVTHENPPVVREEAPPPPVVTEREETPAPGEETIVVKAPPAVEETIVVREAPPSETPPQTSLTEATSTLEEMAQREMILQIQAVEKTWIALQVDSDLPREMILRAGEIFSQRADDHIKLKIGNAGGVQLTFNGESLGSLGDPGKIVRLSLTPEGYEFKKRDEFKIPEYGGATTPAGAD